MSIAEVAQRKFAAHETFAPRFGWLRKAFTAVEEGGHGPDGAFSEAFLAADAPVQLGVGKNMVNAIRYWAQVFEVTEERRLAGNSRAMFARPTDQAQWLFSSRAGVDPWLEQPGSLWLLHWWLLRPECMAPTWWVAFYRCPLRFHEDDLVRLVESEIETAGWTSVSRASIAKDVDCLTKMYAPRRTKPGSPGSVEDMLDSPFRELGILEPVPGELKRWHFVGYPRVPVPDQVVTYACLDYLLRHDTSEMSTARLAQEQGGVGRALRLTEPALVNSLEQACQGVSEMSVTDSIGQRTLTVQGDPRVLRARVIESYYTSGHPNGPEGRGGNT